MGQEELKRGQNAHKHTNSATAGRRRGQGLTCVGRRAFANGEDGAEVVLVLGKALLQALEFPEALAALVLHGAHMLNQVELGLGGVVAQHAVVVAGITLHGVLVLLQVLWEVMEREREGGREGGRTRKKLLQMADSWPGTADSLLLKQLTNEQINSQSRPRCLTPRPLPLQDNCLDCALCLRECLNQAPNGAGEAWEAHKSRGAPRVGRNHVSHPSEVHGLTDGREH